LTKGRENHLGVLEAVISRLEEVSPEDRERIIKTVLTYFGLDQKSPPASSSPFGQAAQRVQPSFQRNDGPSFSDDRSMSPKEFMLFKQPKTDVERVACLAFYLTHYKNNPYFKTIDITQLNTEAAQNKFSNAAYSINNAAKTGYLVPGPKGTRQISGVGERFVQALPDRDAAREVMTTSRRRKRAGKT
jgi:hypothetical protein